MRKSCFKLLFVFCLASCFSSLSIADASKNTNKELLDKKGFKSYLLTTKSTKIEQKKHNDHEDVHDPNIKPNSSDNSLKTAKANKNFNKEVNTKIDNYLSKIEQGKNLSFYFKLGPHTPSEYYNNSQHTISSTAELYHIKKIKKNSAHHHNSVANVAEQERARSLGPTFTPASSRFPFFGN